MNSQSDTDGLRGAVPEAYAGAAFGAHSLGAFLAPPAGVGPFEFRSLSFEDALELGASIQMNGGQAEIGNGDGAVSNGADVRSTRGDSFAGLDRASREAAVRSAIESARQEGLHAGEREGRRLALAEMEVEIDLAATSERASVAHAVAQFRGARERYFAEVEQEVVKLALAIAGRVLHREAQIDPLLLAGVVRVALEKMADRSGVVVRVSGADVAGWEEVFRATEASERPRIAEDARLKRGECVLETKMGTVELGVQVQLEEIEKGFFDLLNHRPVE